MSYLEIIEQLPPELRRPFAQLVDALREEFGVRRADFDELRGVVRDLAQAQRRTEERLAELAQAQKRTEEATARLEERTGRLEEATARLQEATARLEDRVGRLEEAVARLAEAQARTEQRVEELALAQKRTEEELTLFRRTFTSQIGGLGARWGLQSEEAFRQGIRSILKEVGFTVERFVGQDSKGEVFGYPEQIELDIIARNGTVIVAEIKSSLDQSATYAFARKVEFYSRTAGRSAARKLIITPYAEPRAKETGVRLGIEICTDINTL
jgi:hypothetical protein